MKSPLYFLPLCLFLLLVIGLGVKLYEGKTVPQSPLVGKPLPSFSLPALIAKQPPLDSQNFRGKVVLVNIFASWCISCRMEHPLLLQLSKKNLLPIMGIDWKDTDSAAQEWLQNLGNPYTAIGTDKEGKVAINLGVTGAPESFLVGKDGIIIYHLAGPLSEDIIEKIIVPLALNAL